MRLTEGKVSIRSPRKGTNTLSRRLYDNPMRLETSIPARGRILVFPHYIVYLNSLGIALPERGRKLNSHIVSIVLARVLWFFFSAANSPGEPVFMWLSEDRV